MGRHALFAVLLLAGCIEPALTICGDTACSNAMVCDGHGGCALPEQIRSCAERETGLECHYEDAYGSCIDGVCRPYGCGNGFVTADEVCDDENTSNGDGCAADCRSIETCGNSVVDVTNGEQCDDGNANNDDGCHVDCRLPRCGDGIVDILLNEACDEGPANSNVANATCRAICQLPRCGDGVTDSIRGEICDDANLAAGDGCSPDCLSTELCGNGITDFLVGEQCDDGNNGARDGCSRCLAESLITLAPRAVPPPRSRQAAAYDGARERLVVFGGILASNGYTSETWEHDGASWTQLRPRTAPTARSAAAMAYDPKRKRVVLFGGDNASGGLDDTWEWDGVDWVQMMPTTRPPTGNFVAMAWDGLTEELLLVAGGNPGTTYTWNGTRWLARAHVNPLINAPHGAAAYDPVLNRVVLVIDDRTFVWDGMEWNNLGSSPLPSNTTVALAFHAGRGNVVLWPELEGQLYELVGSSWVPLGATLTPRAYASLAYDAVRRQLVLYGGAPNGDETWVFSSSWSLFASNAFLPSFHEPAGRRAGAMAYDPRRGRAVLMSDMFSTQDLWEFDGRRWTTPLFDPDPSQVYAGVMTYDTKNRALVMYGGRDDEYQFTGTLVRRGPVSWTSVAPALSPPTFNAMVTYDSTHDELVVFGGTHEQGCQCASAATSIWNGTSWSSSSTGGPPARRTGAMAHDPRRGLSVLFGGTLGQHAGMADTWEWDGTSWHDRTPAHSTLARTGNAMAFHADLGRVMMVGGYSTQPLEVWEWSGTAWSQRMQSSTDVERYRPSLAYHAVARGLLMFGGQDVAGGDLAATRLFQFRPFQTPEACTSAALDYDNDGLAGCADPECWARCTPLCTPGVPCDPTLPRCGDGMCGGVEDCKLCPGDCGVCTGGVCGDFHCDPNETATSCTTDC